MRENHQFADVGSMQHRQRLRQNNLGSRLVLSDGELLLAQGPVFPVDGRVRQVRMLVRLDGSAERSYHEIAKEYSLFHHCWTRFDESRLSELVESLRAVRRDLERDSVRPKPDPDAIGRVIQCRDAEEVVVLCVQYEWGVAAPPAPLFEAAWECLERQFFLGDPA